MLLLVKITKWYCSSQETHLRVTERHLPCGTTQYYLSPDTGGLNTPSHNSSQTGWYSIYLRFTYLGGMGG